VAIANLICDGKVLAHKTSNSKIPDKTVRIPAM